MNLDIMVDIETTGISPGCGLLAIGCTSLDGKFAFYRRINPGSNFYYGLVADPSTLAWWEKQSKEARKEAFSGTEDLLSVLGAFMDFMESLERVHKDVYIWGNGADFDLPILATAYKMVGFNSPPWKPFNGRCYRTLKNLPFAKDIIADKFEGVRHTALADAQFQARHMLKILKKMKELQGLQGGSNES